MTDVALLVANDEALYRTGPSGVITTIEECRNPDHRSYSGDRKWDECQYEAHVVESGLAKSTWPAKVAVGSAVDAAVKSQLLGEPFDLDGLVVHYFKEYGSPVGDFAKAVEKAHALYALWEREVWPEWERVGVYAVDYELHFTVERVVYHVHIDVILRDGTVIDLKTSDERLDRTGNGRADFDVQLTTYCYAVNEVFDHLPPEVILDGLIYGNPPVDVVAWKPEAVKPWWDRQRATRTPEQLAAFREDVRRREASRRFARTTGLYQTQGRAHPWACKTCPAKSICPSWTGFITVEGSKTNAA